MAQGDLLISLPKVTLGGELLFPENPLGLVIFAHGSGSSRRSPRNQYVASVLREARLGTFLFDLLTTAEEQAEARTRHLRFDIPFLAERLVAATRWISSRLPDPGLRIGYFGSSTGAAAALVAGAELGHSIGAAVSRGGRPDLADAALDQVTAPTLFIVGSADEEVLELNEKAQARLRCENQIHIVPGASHLFEEPGALEKVAKLAAAWFTRHLSRP